MTFANINIGTTPDDHTGDPLRVAFEKINRNFANITSGSNGVNSVAGRSGNVILSVNDVLGAVSIGALPDLVAEALGDISVPTTTDMSDAIAVALSTAEAYTDSAIGNLFLDAPDGLQTIKQLADAIGDDPTFYMQVVNLRNGLTSANVSIASNTSNIAGLWANAALQTTYINSLNSTFSGTNANIAGANAAIANNSTSIASLQTVTGGHTTAIASTNANVAAANVAISNLQNAGYATTSYVNTQITNVVGTAPAALDTLKELADALNNDSQFATHYVNSTTAINANMVAANSAITALQTNTASLASSINAHTTQIASINANVTAANLNITVLQGNTATLASQSATHTSQIASINANVTAANSAIATTQSNLSNTANTVGTHTTSINSLNVSVSGLNTSVSQINANVTAANTVIATMNSNLGLLNGTVGSINTTVNTHQNLLTTGPISITGNITGNNVIATNRLITTHGIFWANGTAFISGGGGAVNTGNIIFDGDTISTVNNQDAGITFNAAGNGEIHIKNNTGINNSNPGAWLEVGNLTDNINTGNIALNFSNNNGYQGSAMWSWNWSDGLGNGTFSDRPAFKKFGLYKNGDLNNYWLEVDSTATTANVITISGTGTVFAGDTKTTGNAYAPFALLGKSVSNSIGARGTAPLYVSLNDNDSSIVSTNTDTIAKFIGNETGPATILVDGFGASPSVGPLFLIRSSRGTISAPSAIQQTDILARFVGRGFGTTKFSTTAHAGVVIVADADFTDASQPSSVLVSVVQPNASAPKAIAKFASSGNVILNNGTVSTSTQTGTLIVFGGAGMSGNLHIGQNIVANSGNISASHALLQNSITAKTLNLTSFTDSSSTTSGALVVAGGGGFGGNVTIGENLEVDNDVVIAGRLTVESSNDIADGSENEALHVDGGARIYGSAVIGHQLFIGNDQVNTASVNSVLDMIMPAEFAGGSLYTQVSLNNAIPSASVDFAGYSDIGDESAGWIDMGFAGSQFADATYTITKPSDGYIFASAPNNSGQGGNLVLATANTGSFNDIVFGVGSFDQSAEVARFHGNVSTGGRFTVQTDMTVNGNLRINGTIQGQTRSNVVVTTTTLAPNANTTVIATGFAGYALYAIKTSANAWVSVYNGNTAAGSDNVRAITTDPTPNSGVVAEVITTSNAAYYFTPAITGYTVDGSTSIPLRVNNQSNVSQTITVTMTMLKLEG